MKSWLLPCFCLYLAGCGATDKPTSSIDDSGQSQMAALPADAPLEITITQFPGGYQGRWAVEASDCLDENEARMISLQGKLVKFHEAIGTMTAGKRQTSRTMEADFEFVGEGDKWNKSIAFELSKDRKQLTRTDKNDSSSYRYVQCPKLMAG